MIMRGVIAGLVALLIVAAIVAPTAAQPTADSFGVDDVLANPGTVVSIPVTIENVQGGPIISVLFTIAYDSSVLTVNSVQRGNLTSSWDSPTVNTVGNTTSIVLVYDTVLAHAIQNGSMGSVAVIDFTVVGAGGSSSGMNLSTIQLATGAPDYLVGTAPARDGFFRVDAGAPAVTDPSADPDTIEADGVQETRLNVTVEDDSPGEQAVTINLTQLGGPAAKPMAKIGDVLYSTTTTAAQGTAPGVYYLPITATDVLGNVNSTETIMLTIAAPPVGAVSGTITYACNGTGIAGVTVNLTQNESVIATALTDGNGNYTFAGVNPDEYIVSASKQRLWANETAVTVTVGATETADMALWLKGDLNNNCLQADAGDMAKMKDAAVGKIGADARYDLNNNALFVDAGDVAKMKDASVGIIEIL